NASTAARPDMPAPITQIFCSSGARGTELIAGSSCLAAGRALDIGASSAAEQIIDQLVSLLFLHSAVMPVKSQRRSRGRPRASEREALQTRRALIDAAAKLIADRGYRGTTVNDVAQRSGLSK